MKILNSTQRKKLRGMAHGFKPLVFIGQKGLTSQLIQATDDALLDHELIKIKFIDCKEEKKEIIAELAAKVSGQLAGMVGNVAVMFREHPEEKKRKVVI
ncbi:MAG: YhbY family RNA-binding protein [bacterium]|nr:YhbY family RNA-binding protein [bacterium]MBU1918141.1 YhbY family RNA-binding protein [bacterium]